MNNNKNIQDIARKKGLNFILPILIFILFVVMLVARSLSWNTGETLGFWLLGMLMNIFTIFLVTFIVFILMYAMIRATYWLINGIYMEVYTHAAQKEVDKKHKKNYNEDD